MAYITLNGAQADLLRSACAIIIKRAPHCAAEALKFGRRIDMGRVSPVALQTLIDNAFANGAQFTTDEREVIGSALASLYNADTYDTTMLVRMSTRERGQLDANAERAGMNASEYVRARCCREES